MNTTTSSVSSPFGFTRFLLFLSLGLLCLTFPRPAAGAAPASPFPLLGNAHAHNDYLHARPLFEALEQGFCSVEADIHLVNGKLLVGHDLAATRPDRTLERLYLDPLRARARLNHGHIYPEAGEFTLLIDIKTHAFPTYDRLREVLADYRSILTQFSSNQITPGAVTVILSGERPITLVKAERVRWCALDGRPEDLETNPPAGLFPWISSGWSTLFKGEATGELSPDEAARLRSLLAKTHVQGRKFRFWGTRDDAATWGFLQKAGVDVLNADDLPGLRRFLVAPR